MTLYEIDEAILNCVDIETGEVIDMEKLEQLHIERERKVENVGLWIKDLKAEADAIKNEERRLAQRRKVLENKMASLKSYLEYALDGEKFKTPRLSISYRKTESVNVTNVWDIEQDYVTYPDPVPNKADIKKALKEGKDIKGVELLQSVSMIVR